MGYTLHMIHTGGIIGYSPRACHALLREPRLCKVNPNHPPVRGSQDMTPTPPRDTLFKLYVLVWIPPGGIILNIEKFRNI